MNLQKEYILMSKYICRFCNSAKISSKLLINNFPLAPQSTKIPRFESFDFHIGICDDCSLVQQLSEVSSEILYKEFKNDVVGEKLNNQKLSFCKYISHYLKKNMTVLEMGSGNGLVINKLAELNKSVKFIANDYNLNLKNESSNIVMLEGDIHSYEFNDIDMIFSSHVFEHIADPKYHLIKIKRILKIGGLYVMAIPLFESWIKKLNLNSFTAEHFIYPFEDDLIAFFNNMGFEKVASEAYLDHSFYICFRKLDSNQKPILSKSKSVYMDNFSKNLNNLKNFMMNITTKHKKIVLWGANSSSQLILSVMSKINNVECSLVVVDNSKLKIGGYLFGTDIKIESPNVIASLSQKDAVVIMLGTFDDEVKRQCTLINPNVKIYDKSFITSN